MSSRAQEGVGALALVGAGAEGDSPERRAGRADTIALIENGGVEALWENQRPKLLLEDASERAGGRVRVRELVLARGEDELTEAERALRDPADNPGTFASFDG